MRKVRPFAPEQLRELHDRNRDDAPNPISAEDLAEFLRQPDFWREGSSAVVLKTKTQDEIVDAGLWMQNIYRDLGMHYVVVPPAPKFTDRQLKSFKRFTFRLFFIPTFTEDAYPTHFVKPDWRRHLDENQIERRPLPGKWVAAETIAKPNWQSGDYHEDRLAAAVGLKSRFGVSWDDLHQGGLLQQIAKVTGFPRKGVRLPTAEEWNFLANLFRELVSLRGEILPDLGSTDSREWCENAYGSHYRLFVGYHEGGGLANVSRCGRSHQNDSLAFRVLVEL